MNRKRYRHRALLVLLIAWMCFIAPIDAWSQNDQSPSALESIQKRPAERQDNYDVLLQSVEDALSSENENLVKLKMALDSAESLEESLADDLSAYKAQISSHSNLLLLPEVQIERLEKAKNENLSSLDAVSPQLNALKKSLQTISLKKQQIEAQYTLNENQLADIQKSGIKNEKTSALKRKLQQLLHSLAANKRATNKLESFYTGQIGPLDDIRKSLVSLSKKFDQQLKEKKKEALFQRKGTPFGSLKWQHVSEDFQELTTLISWIFSAEFESDRVQTIRKYGDVQTLILFLFLMLITILLVRFRIYCARKETVPFFAQFPWHHVAFRMFYQSSIIGGLILFLYVMKAAQPSSLPPSTVRVTFYLLTVWLTTKWWLDFLKLLNQKSISPFTGILTGFLRPLVTLSRYFSTGYILITWMIGGERAIVVLCRMGFEICFFVWYLVCLRKLKRASLEASSLPGVVRRFLHSFLPGIGYIIAGGGFILESIGYGSFALYWILSWGRTAVIFLWAFLLFQVLKEWGRHLREVADKALVEAAQHAYPVRWFLNRLCWLIWLAALFLSISFAWGGRHVIIVSALRLLNKTIMVGSLSFNLMSLFYACLIVFITLAGTRIWRNILNQKILTEKVLEPGLKESVETISVYLIWGIGGVIGLNILGVSSTSLAVVFGALSIGLGFGLQNIFNNFISGIILLFERPIQVGDAVELNGIWGEVRKINVRATVVQTYDNASLIIPNSEFISSQVTNWSFKDLRLRRKITVGVAYGSDIELVRKTLLEVADANHMVLKIPKPDTLFTDFGDSALIFVLRIWTDVDRMLICETAIRFEIDRLFRERGIEISFPQRDIHIRSITEDNKLRVASEQAGELEKKE